MKLVLSVISSKENLQHSSRVTLNQENATLGRQEDNTIVLHDPKLFISNHHALIQFSANAYYITDISTNGVFINNSAKPLGKGNKIKLKDGDKIQIGDYNISVKLVDTSLGSSFTSREDPIPKATATIDDPFADFSTDTVDKLIKENELIPPSKNLAADKIEDPFADFPDNSFVSKNNSDSRLDSTAFEHIPAHKQVFEEPYKPKSEITPNTNGTDKALGDWSFLDIEAEKKQEKPDEPPDSSESKLPNNTAKLGVENKSETHHEFIRQFLLGAQLDEKSLGSISPQAFFIIGTIIRESIQGTRDVLEGRARIKNEMHLDITYIKPKENNPIKFAASTDEAIIKLLSPTQKGYLPADKAIDEAFSDIRAHQYSVIAGMKSALLEILKRFDPKILEQRLQKQSPITSYIPIHRQAELWGLFEDLYETIIQETKDNFYHLFGQAFADTYSEFVNKLKK